METLLDGWDEEKTSEGRNGVRREEEEDGSQKEAHVYRSLYQTLKSCSCIFMRFIAYMTLSVKGRYEHRN